MTITASVLGENYQHAIDNYFELFEGNLEEVCEAVQQQFEKIKGYAEHNDDKAQKGLINKELGFLGSVLDSSIEQHNQYSTTLWGRISKLASDLLALVTFEKTPIEKAGTLSMQILQYQFAICPNMPKLKPIQDQG